MQGESEWLSNFNFELYTFREVKHFLIWLLEVTYWNEKEVCFRETFNNATV